jgi:O-antigen/teichoic acid export membrane protein
VSGLFACGYAFYKLRPHLVSVNSKSSALTSGEWAIDKKQMRKHIFLTGMTIGLWMLANRTVESLLLKQFSTPEVLGFFVLAGTLSKAILDMMIGGFEKVLLPMMSKKVGDGGGQNLAGIVSESVRLYVAIGMFNIGLAVLGSEGLIRVLYGKAFEGAALPLMISLVSGGLFVFIGALNAFQISTDNQADRIKGMLLTLIPTVGIAYLLVPKFGLAGAAVSVAISQFFNTAVSVVQVRKKLKFAFPLNSTVRLLGASLTGTCFCWLLKHELPEQWGFVPAVLLYVLLFFILSVLFRSWKIQDFDAVCAIVDRTSLGNRGLGNIVRRLRNKFAVN